MDILNHPVIQVGDTTRRVDEYIWEKNYGTIPFGKCIFHKDYNNGNWNLSNMELVTFNEYIERYERWYGYGS